MTRKGRHVRPTGERLVEIDRMKLKLKIQEARANSPTINHVWKASREAAHAISELFTDVAIEPTRKAGLHKELQALQRGLEALLLTSSVMTSGSPAPAQPAGAALPFPTTEARPGDAKSDPDDHRTDALAYHAPRA
jgi:hypothetical protein